MMLRWVFVAATAAAHCTLVLAESGPEVPCDPCTTEVRFDAPRSGLWFNPERPGHGLTIEIQNGLLLGAIYAYDADGGAQWYIFNGPLEMVEGAETYTLGLTAELERFEGGTCIGCEYTAPTAVRDIGSVTIEFSQRNYGAYSINGGEREFIIPAYAGIDAPLDFPALVEYPFPVLTGGWVFVFDDPEVGAGGAEGELWGTRSTVLQIADKSLQFASDNQPFRLRYSIFLYTGTSDISGVGTFECNSGVDSNLIRLPPECTVRLNLGFPGAGQGTIFYPLAYADIGDNRLEALDLETGIRLTAYRLGYD